MIKNVHCSSCKVHRSSCNVHRSSCNVHRSSYNVHCSSCNVHCSSCNVPIVFLSNFNGTWNASTDYQKSWRIKFQENPARGRQVVPRWRTVGQTERAMDVLHNVATAPINGARFTVSDSERFINRNILLQTETHMMFEPVRTQWTV